MESEPKASGEHRGGEEAGFESLFREHREAVVRLCRRLVGPQGGEDAVQEVYLRARRGFQGYDPERPFRGWLLGIAGNHCIDQLRRRAREQRLFQTTDFDSGELPAAGPSPLAHSLLAERRGEVLQAIEALPEKYRLPLVLRYFRELDYDEIGDVLDVTRNQVGSLLFRAKRRLREALNAEEPR